MYTCAFAVVTVTTYISLRPKDACAEIGPLGMVSCSCVAAEGKGAFHSSTRHSKPVAASAGVQNPSNVLVPPSSVRANPGDGVV